MNKSEFSLFFALRVHFSVATRTLLCFLVFSSLLGLFQSQPATNPNPQTKKATQNKPHHHTPPMLLF